MEEKQKEPFYKKWWFFGIAAIVIIGVITSLWGNEDPEVDNEISTGQPDSIITETNTPTRDNREESKNDSWEASKGENEEPEKTEEPEEIIEEEPKPKETLSQKNAVGKAKDYLSVMAYSKSGLIKQLEFEGFDNEDATYAVNKINVNWKEQAVKKGRDYLDIMNYSRSGLIKQLEFEGFTNEEATYAVDEIGF
ncbi:MAG: Ltp family lipoprotein [Natronincolaceae bacterium]|jgi:hypothetical protein|nr:Ltp family lipoprotein [Bacillota bacterium]